MSYRKGYQYMTLVVPEDTYGVRKTALTKAGDVWLDVINVTRTKEIVNRKLKSGTLEPMQQEQIASRLQVEVTVSGELCSAHLPTLINALLLDNTLTTNWKFKTDMGSKYSYTIYQKFTDKVHYIIGCVLKSLKFTFTSGQPVTFEAIFNGNDYSLEEAWDVQLSGSTWNPAYPALGEPMTFNETVLSFLGTEKSPISMSMSFTNEFISDDELYRNTEVKKEVIVSGSSGEVDIELPYDTTLTIPNFLDQETLNELVVGISNGNEGWNFDMFGQMIDHTLQDPDRGLFHNSFKFRLAGSSAHPALTVIEI